MSEPVVLALHGDAQAHLLPTMANRHGLITGATGTGKTVTLQVLAEAFSAMGTPVFLADIKGDLTGLGQPGLATPKMLDRLSGLGMPVPAWSAFPAALWDVFGQAGHPLRATIQDLGPVLLARMLSLNDTQSGVLAVVFKVAQDEGQLLVDLDDLRAMLADVAARAPTLQQRYGNVSAASVGAIQRTLLVLETQGAQAFFGEPALDVDDLMHLEPDGRGRINILAADQL
ncbi:MAG: helicase HerA-like domain-containing protein, partial [Burkholderiaceae bacterium]